MYGPTDRETDEIHRYHVYVGLTQARPNKVLCLATIKMSLRIEVMTLTAL